MENFTFEPNDKLKKETSHLSKKDKPKPHYLKRLNEDTELEEENLESAARISLEKEPNDSFVDIYYNSTGGENSRPGGSDFQNKFTSHLIERRKAGDDDKALQKIIDDLIEAISMDRRIKKQPGKYLSRRDSDVVATMMGIVSVFKFLEREEEKELEPGTKRFLGFNDYLDDVYSTDVVDIEYEIDDGQLVVKKLHLVQIKTSENEARRKAQKIADDHRLFVENFRLTARWHTPEMIFDGAKEEIMENSSMEKFVDDEITDLTANLDKIKDINVDEFVSRFKKKLERDPNVDDIILLEKLIKDYLRDEDVLAIYSKEVLEVLLEAIEEYKKKYTQKFRKKSKPVIFSSDAEIKSIITAESDGGVIESLTKDLPAPK